MTPHSIEPAVGVTAHRPMSLLLQALKQIESKSPSTRTVVPSDTDGGDRQRYLITSPDGERGADRDVEVQQDGRLIELPPIVVLSNPGATTSDTVSGSTYHLYRRYDASETASEIAVADPVELAAVRSVPDKADGPVIGPNWRSQRDQRKDSEQIVHLLPEESRSVIAIVSVEGIETSVVVLNVCESLAARGIGKVLAIADFDAPAIADRTTPTLVDLVSGTAELSDVVDTDVNGEISLLARGDLSTLANVSRRRLLKVWEDFGNQYAYVVLDATADEAGDMTALLATCDAAFIALRLNETHRRDAERVVATVRMQGCQPCGCLVVDS